jgi:peptidoglycan/LPS O-acetylase OafA/YrhL
MAMRSGGLVSSCGCAGTPDTPPTVGHLVVNSLAVTAAAVALIAEGGVGPWPTATLPFIASVLVVVGGAALAYLVITDGARLSGALQP